MSYDIAKLAIQQTDKYTNQIHIGGRGEPLLCKNILEILELVVKYKRKLKLTTNGNKLKSMFNDLDRILNLRSSFGKYKLIVNCYQGEHQYIERKKLYKDYPGIYITMDRSESNADNNIKSGILTNRGGDLNFNNGNANRPCYVLFHQTIINWNGDINLCCHDWKNITHFGNITNTPFSDIWEKGILNYYRHELIKGNRHKFLECRNCDSIENINTSFPLYQKWRSGIVESEYQQTQFI